MVSVAMRSWRSRERHQGAHVVQPVGQLDEDDADVLDHGQQHLADALGLPVLTVGEVDFTELGDAVDAARHVVAEGAGQFLIAGLGVLQNVVQQGVTRHTWSICISARIQVTSSGCAM